MFSESRTICNRFSEIFDDIINYKLKHCTISDI